MATSDIAIEVDDLTARFGDNTVLRDVSLKVARGEIVIIAGGSGCGKSTLLKHIIGLHRPATGRILIDGVDVTQGDNLERVRRNIGVLFQSGALFGSMPLWENIALPLMDFAGLSQRAAKEVARMKLSLVGLEGYDNHLPDEISGGMQKRAGLARAMALDPAILFFDEPAAGLDPITSAELDELIMRINTGLGTTMMIVTHELAQILAVGHRVVMLDKSVKGVIAQGPPRELAERSNDPRVKNFFQRRATQKEAA